MMLGLLVAAPFLLVLVLFALSNPQAVQLGLWPTDFTIEAPLSLVVLVGMGIAFLLGALMLWINVLGARVRARRAERRVRKLDGELRELQARARLQPSRAALQAPTLGPLLPRT